MADEPNAIGARTRNRTRSREVVVDRGYRGADADNPGVEAIHRGRIEQAFFVVCPVALQRPLIVSATLSPTGKGSAAG